MIGGCLSLLSGCSLVIRVNIGGETLHNDNTGLSGESAITILNIQVILSIEAHLCCDGH